MARTRVGLSPLHSEVIPSILLILTRASAVPLKYFGRLYHLYEQMRIVEFGCLITI